MLLFLADFVGLVGLYTARKLFAGYQRGEIFTPLAACRLRLIGWVIVLLAPISLLTEIIGAYIFSAIAEPGSLILHIAVESTDVYAIVFGLLIVVVGHVMYEAARIYDENRSFV